MAGPKGFKLTPEDFADAPAEVKRVLEKLFVNLNPFIADTADSLDRRLTLTGNLISTVKTVDVMAPDWVPVASSGSTNPYFQNSWVNFGGGHEDAAIWIDDQGWTRFRGIIKDGSAISTVAFTLPADYWPAKHRVLVGSNNDGFGRNLNISASTGEVRPNTGGTSAVMLDGLGFDRDRPPPAFSGTGWPITLTPGFVQPILSVQLLSAMELESGTTYSHAAAGVDWIKTPKGVQIRRVGGLVPGRTYRLTFLLLAA